MLLGTGYNFAKAAPMGLIMLFGMMLLGKGTLLKGVHYLQARGLHLTESPVRSARLGTSTVLLTAWRRRVTS